MLKPDNGLNLVRLAMVVLVILSHSYTIGRHGGSPLYLGNTSGQWALAGLFSVSGFLVSSGRLRRGLALYLWHRVLRLWPAFMLCLLVIVLLFAPVAYILERGSISGFFGAQSGPGPFLLSNSLFEIRQYTVSGTPNTDPAGWIGNLWTVFFTVVCYVAIGVVLGIRRERVRLLVLVSVFVLTVVAHANIDAVMTYAQDGRVAPVLRFLPFFLGGTIIYELRRRLRLSVLFALPAAGATALLALLFPAWALQMASPLIAYCLLVLGNILPAPRVLRANDLAMGAFMYSYAVQMLLRVFGVPALVDGVWAFFALSVLATVPFAIGSWLLAERPVIRRLRSGEGRPERNVDGTARPIKRVPQALL
ncbi:acyltransferase family protein [Herbiconiux liukaitaii]|uniref:acyltransferase family protein n=1 Tax=Herbiconiux liukaitaii TaxID=3342799 RepID=UPI0035BAFC83